MRSLVSFGANSQAAAGFNGASEMTDIASLRLPPQHIKPIPTGRTPDGTFGIGDDWFESIVSFTSFETADDSVPPPRKPMPFARETARARGAVAMILIGAEVMRGKDIHGY